MVGAKEACGVRLDIEISVSCLIGLLAANESLLEIICRLSAFGFILRAAAEGEAVM
jgi:hypothetical protein